MAAPLSAGDWRYVSDTNASRALFGTGTNSASFTVACEPSFRQVKLWRPVAAGSGAGSMTITTTEAERALPGQIMDAGVPQLVATLAPYDPILDAMVFTRGRLAVQASGAETLYLPSWPEIARVVEDCR